ncbi:hypothetical protein [Microbacterium suaedae]|nr:hypothetical protein [Microbacterium suaedae]
MPGFHHVELWVDDISAARDSWGWLLERFGFAFEQAWLENAAGFKVEIVAEA